jgi:hypothetical protein
MSRGCIARMFWRSVLRIALVICLGACVTACDGGFRVRGSIEAQSKPMPAICKVELKGPPDALICCNRDISPPTVDIRFTVAPAKASYKLVLLCDGFQAVEHDFKYGSDTTPTKPLDLGVIRLRSTGP